MRLLRAKIEKEHGSEACLERCGGCSAAPTVHAPPYATDFFARSRLQQAKHSDGPDGFRHQLTDERIEGLVNPAVGVAN